MSQANMGLESYETTVGSSSQTTIKEGQTLLDVAIRNDGQVADGCGNCSTCKC